MADKIVVRTLGHSGVIIDPNPLEPTIPDDALRVAQNATHDPRLGFGGAIRKRAGLKRFNSVYAGGIILGGIPMAVVGTGGAPAVPPGGGSGATGSGPGGGDGTGGPGGVSIGSDPAFAPPGAGIFGGGGLFSGARLVLVGYADNSISNQNGEGWYVTSKGLANVASKVTTPGPPAGIYAYPPTALFPVCFGTPSVYHPDSGYLFYAAASDQVNSELPTIRKTNGAEDVLVARVAYNVSSLALVTGPGTAMRVAITAMILGSDGNIHIGIKDRAKGQSTIVTAPVTDVNVGRLAQLDPITGAYTDSGTFVIPNVSPLNSLAVHNGIPYALAFFQNSLFWGEFNLSASELQKDTNSVIFVTNAPGTLITDHAFSDGEATTVLYPFPQTAPASNPAMNVLANQVLFCGFAVNKTSPTQAVCYTRDRSAPTTSTAYSASLVSTSGGAQNGNYFVSMIAFKDNLYASYYNPADVAKIYKFVPDYTQLAADGFWDGSGTWSTVFTSGIAAEERAHHLFVDQDTIYAIGSNGDVAGASAIHALVSTDGTTWTDKSTDLSGAATHTVPIPVFFAVDQ